MNRKKVCENGKYSRRFNLEENPVFQDHKIGKNPVLPAVHAMAWMVDVCEQELPGFMLSSCENFKVLNGIKFDESLAAEYVLELQEIERLNGNFTDIEVKVSSLSGSRKRQQKTPPFSLQY